MPRKIIILSAILLLPTLNITAQKLAEMNIAGKVRKVTETLYNIQNKEQKLYSRNIYFFSTGGQLERTENYSYKADTLYFTSVWLHNKMEKVTETNNYRSSDSDKTLNQYDKLGNIVKIESVREGKTTVVTYTNKYDKKDRLIEKAVYGRLGIFKRSTMGYDKAGNKITEFVYNEASGLEYADTFTYDKHNNRIKNVHHIAGDKSSSSTSTTRYDSLNRKTEETIYKQNGDMDWKHSYEYDPFGDLLKNRFYYSSGYYEDTFYEYSDRDISNNWQKKTITEYGEPRRIVQRAIEYY